MTRQSEKVSLVFPGRTCSTRNSPVSASVRATASDKSMFCILTTMLLIELPPYTLRIAEMKVLHINQMAIFRTAKQKSRPQAAFCCDIQFFRFRITSPISRARTASSVRFLKPVFSSMLRMCVLTVATDMCSRSAIS